MNNRTASRHATTAPISTPSHAVAANDVHDPGFNQDDRVLGTFRPQVGHVVGAAQLQQDEVVNLVAAEWSVTTLWLG
jgi:hypothetical protein